MSASVQVATRIGELARILAVQLLAVCLPQITPATVLDILLPRAQRLSVRPSQVFLASDTTSLGPPPKPPTGESKRRQISVPRSGSLYGRQCVPSSFARISLIPFCSVEAA